MRLGIVILKHKVNNKNNICMVVTKPQIIMIIIPEPIPLFF